MKTLASISRFFSLPCILTWYQSILGERSRELPAGTTPPTLRRFVLCSRLALRRIVRCAPEDLRQSSKSFGFFFFSIFAYRCRFTLETIHRRLIALLPIVNDIFSRIIFLPIHLPVCAVVYAVGLFPAKHLFAISSAPIYSWIYFLVSSSALFLAKSVICDRESSLRNIFCADIFLDIYFLLSFSALLPANHR